MIKVAIVFDDTVDDIFVSATVIRLVRRVSQAEPLTRHQLTSIEGKDGASGIHRATSDCHPIELVNPVLVIAGPVQRTEARRPSVGQTGSFT